MKLSYTAMLLLLGASLAAQPAPVPTPNPTVAEVQNYSLEANTFVEALLKIAAQFHLPMGVEWKKTADTLKPVRFSRSDITVAEILDAVVATHAGYEWRTEDGVVHVFQRDLSKDSRNPLNIMIGSFDQKPETVGWANNNLSQIVSHVVRHPETQGMAGSVLGYPGEPVYTFAALNAPARSILNKIVTAEFSARQPRPQRVWIATFPEKPVLSRTGFLEVAPVWNLNNDSDQPFWILMPWGDSPPEPMMR